jgi:penicillin-binding protein 1A
VPGPEPGRPETRRDRLDHQKRTGADRKPESLDALLARLKAAGVLDRRKLVGAAVLGMVASGFFGTGMAAAAWTRACANGCPTASQIASFNPRQATELYDRDGALLGMFFRERRQLVSLAELPPHVSLAFVAIEDRRFFEHEGVDLRRLIGAARDNLLGGYGGGSTITMQLARNLFPEQLPSGEKTIRRKTAEIRVALDMERRFPKQRILELYLNHVYLGSGAYGIEAAAQSYFGKSARELTVIEAATIAGLPQAPHHYDPRRNPHHAERRRNTALAAMAATGVISRAEADSLRAEDLVLAPPRGAIRAPYFIEHIRRELEDQFGELLYTGGLKIYTTLDAALQEAAEQGLEEQLRAIEAGRNGRFTHISYEKFQEERKPGEPVTSTPYLQGLVTALDPKTGDVLAMVGGRDFRHSQFNRSTQALRQPGSAFKPFVYAAALANGRSPNSTVSDQPLFLTQDDGTTWTPRNYSGDFGGMLSLREALRTSRNLATIRVGQDVGIPAVRDVAERAGLDTRIPGYPSVFIGAAEVYPLDMIAAYATFANGGMRVEPRFVRRIEDHEGRLLWEPPVRAEPTIDPGLAWLVTDMLREVVDRGTGFAARNPQVGNLPYSIPAAGKTGTTNDATDVWFVGYTPDIVAGVWLGLDAPRTIMRGATGGGLAVPIWARVVRTFHADRDAPVEWVRPSTVVTRNIDRWTGRAVPEGCRFAVEVYTDFFLASAAPAPVCEPTPQLEWTDPTPHLPGRPVFPGQARVPRPEDYVDQPPPAGRRRGRP